MSTLSRDAIVRGLMEQSVPRHMAEAAAERELAAAAAPRATKAPIRAPERPEPAPLGRSDATIPPNLEPIVLRIPWSCLVSDNAKFRAGTRRTHSGSIVGAIVLTMEYRSARDAIKRLAKDTMAGRPAIAQPLQLLARVWVPNNQPRDVVNFSKALHDALQGVVYADDRWLFDIRWLRAGVDIDAPRCELTISPILP